MNYLRLILVCFLLIPAAGSAASPTSSDDVLVAMTSGDWGASSTKLSTTCYQRFGEYVLVGVPREAARRMKNRFILVDAQPWTEPYAVVSNLRGALSQDMIRGRGAQVLFVEGDIFFVKTQQHVLDQLRSDGFDVVPVEPIPIDIRKTVKRFPTSPALVFDGEIGSIISRVSDSMIVSGVQRLQDFGTRYYLNANRDSIANWLRGQFTSMGIVDVVLDSFQYNNTWQKNVVATIPGSSTNEIIVGAHFDSYSSNLQAAPGADDNASGTSAVLEMARVLKLIDYEPSLTLRFIGFAAEEAGLRGSASYAQRARQANRDIAVMMNYDMLGYRNQSSSDRDYYVVWYPGSEAFSNLHAAASQLYTTLNPILTSSYRSGSDSYPFYQQNYDAVFSIERDFSPYYHSPNDLLQYLDIAYEKEIVQTGLAMLLILDEIPEAVDNLVLRDRGNGSSMVASWEPLVAPDIASYKVYVGRTPGVYDTSMVTPLTTIEVGGLSQGTTYVIGVSGVDYTAREGMIVERSGVPNIIPLPPQQVVLHGASPILSWAAGEEMDLEGYFVYRSVDSTQTFARTTLLPLIDTTWTDSIGSTPIRHYFVTAIDYSGFESNPSDTLEFQPTVFVEGPLNVLPVHARLHQNFPNPFNGSTELTYELTSKSEVEIIVTDILGRTVDVLVQGDLAPGKYRVRWEPSSVGSGVYFAVLNSGGFRSVVQMLLLK